MDDDDENDAVVPQRRVQVSQEHEDLVVKGEERRFMTFLGYTQDVMVSFLFQAITDMILKAL